MTNSPIYAAAAAVFLLSLAAAVPSSAQITILDNWGTAAESFIYNCTSADCNGGGNFGGDADFGPFNELVQDSGATSSISGSLGTATATSEFVSVAPGLSAMRMTGEATSSSLGIAVGIAHALDLYTYSGPATTIDIVLSLTGTFVPPLAGGNNNGDGIEGTIYLFTDPSDIDEINASAAVVLNCLFECYLPSDSATVVIDDDNLLQNATISLSLNDGDVFYLGGSLRVGAAGGGSASSLESFTVTFSDNTGLTSLAVGGTATDTDGDGVADSSDNCTLAANPAQIDSNLDGYGNACDADLNNDGVINTADLGLLRQVFFGADADADFNGDGVVNPADLGVMRASFFGPPGPSAFAP